MRLSSSSLASCVTTNTSWALVPLRASILKPPVTGIETRKARAVAPHPGNHAGSDRLDLWILGKNLQPGDQPFYIGAVRDDQARHRELLLAERCVGRS